MMPKKNPVQTVPDHEINDVLTVFKADWDIVEDKKVRNELGVLVSRENNWVITDPQIVMALRYGNPHYPPYSVGNEYVAVSEKNEVSDSWVNRTAEAYYKAASGGHLSIQQPGFLQRVSPMWLVLGVLSILLLIAYGIAPFIVEPTIVEKPAETPPETREPVRYNYLGTPVPVEPTRDVAPLPQEQQQTQPLPPQPQPDTRIVTPEPGGRQ